MPLRCGATLATVIVRGWKRGLRLDVVAIEYMDCGNRPPSVFERIDTEAACVTHCDEQISRCPGNSPFHRESEPLVLIEGDGKLFIR